MARVTRIQVAIAIAAVSIAFYIRLTRLPGGSPFELFLLLNILLAVLFRPPAALVSIFGGLAGAHLLMVVEGRVPARYTTMMAVYVVLSGILYFLNHRWYRTKDRADAERAAHAEQRERLLAEAQDANRAKDLLLANVSHELRTPLNAIVGWAVLMTREGAKQEDVRRAGEVIKRNAEALARLVDQLLDVSLAASKGLRLDAAPVSVGETVRAAVESMSPEAAARKVTIHCAVPLDVGTITGDHVRLQQVLLAVLANAIKFTEPGGQVTVTAKTAGDFLSIDVRDTGIGIEPQFLPSIFDQFSQADPSTTRTYGGVGLGLSITKDLVESMGGTIAVASPGRGQGTTVSIRFPVSPDAAARAQART